MGSDVNGDGKVDLVVSNYSGFGSVSVMLGNGDGTFGAQSAVTSGSDTRDVHLVDMNGDGKLDIVAVNEGNNSVSILLGNGNGTFQNQQTQAVGRHPWYAAIADLNGDGKLDMVVARYEAGLANPTEVAQQRGVVAGAEIRLRELEQQEQESLAALAILIGQTPGSLTIAAQRLSDFAEPQIAAGLPAELLQLDAARSVLKIDTRRRFYSLH